MSNLTEGFLAGTGPLGQLGMTEIIRLQNLLQQELTRRFEHHRLVAFSDIVGSTVYFGRFGDAAGRQLQQLHIDLLEQAIRPVEGRIVDTAGDGAFLVFHTAEAAVRGLLTMQRLVTQENLSRSRAHQLQLRMGLHWGPVLTDGVAVSGDAVNVCSRVAGAAAVGQICLTREVFHELDSSHRANCHPSGKVNLKGIPEPVDLLTLDWRDRRQFPTRIRIMETGAVIDLPMLDIISFGRLREHQGLPANDIVLEHPNPELAVQVSRWHFELRRTEDGFTLRPLSDNATEVNQQLVLKGQDVPIKPGHQVRVADTLTLVMERSEVADLSDGGMTMVHIPRPKPKTAAAPDTGPSTITGSFR